MNRASRTFLFLIAALLLMSGSILPNQPQAAQAQTTFRTFLPIVTGGNGTQAGTPSSGALIDRALAEGRIDINTAALYKTFAAFEDPRLPEAYRGDDEDANMTGVIRSVAAQLPNLAPATQAQLAPFFLPPNAPDSWLEQREATAQPAVSANEPTIVWRTVSEAASPVKVWYQLRYAATDAARAEEVFAIANYVVWPELTDLMGRKPLSDSLEQNNGVDDRLDIYIVPTSDKAVPYRGCDKTSAYALLGRNKDLEPSVTALIMQTIMYGYDMAEACSEYDWLFAAMSAWANDHVFADNQHEQQFADDYFAETGGSLEQISATPVFNDAYGKPYFGRYLWLFYLARKLGQPELIRTIWDKVEQTNSLAAINESIPSGFQEQWPQFALAQWNRDPIKEYQQIDQLAKGAFPLYDQQIALTNDGQGTEDIFNNDIDHLGMKYYRFTFPGDASGITFYNGWTYDLQKSPEGAYTFNDVPEELKKGAKVQALVKINGTWQQPQDWTNRPMAFFCRDKQEQRIDELVLVVSNSEWQDREYVFEPVGLAPKIAASNVGCHRWEGTITYKYNTSYKEYPGFSHQTVVSNVVFDAVPVPQDADQELAILYPYSFNASGTLSFNEVYERYVEGQGGPVLDCGGTASGSTAFNNGRLRMGPVLFPDGPGARVYNGEGRATVMVTPPACENEEAQKWDVAFWLMDDKQDPMEATVEANGRRITGRWSTTEGCGDEWENCEVIYEWDFISRPQQ